MDKALDFFRQKDKFAKDRGIEPFDEKPGWEPIGRELPININNDRRISRHCIPQRYFPIFSRIVNTNA